MSSSNVNNSNDINQGNKISVQTWSNELTSSILLSVRIYLNYFSFSMFSLEDIAARRIESLTAFFHSQYMSFAVKNSQTRQQKNNNTSIEY